MNKRHLEQLLRNQEIIMEALSGILLRRTPNPTPEEAKIMMRLAASQGTTIAMIEEIMRDRG